MDQEQQEERTGTKKPGDFSFEQVSPAGSDNLNQFPGHLAADARLAARTLTAMFIFGVFLSVIILGAWLLVNGVIGILFVLSGAFSVAQTLLFLLLGNLFLAVILWLVIIQLSGNLTFNEIFQAVRTLPPQKSDSPQL